MQWPTGVLAATAVGLLLTACSANSGGPATTPSASSPSATPAATTSGSTAMPNLDQFTPAPDGAVNQDTGETVGAQPVPTWDAASRAAVTAAATTALTAFARPGLSYDQWWAALEPLLSAQAQLDYAYVDPANVPAKAVTGAAQIVDESSAYVAHVQVPTDVGTYTLVLSRVDGSAAWLTERITPPAGAN
jgi:hypothetical protein